MNDLQVRQEYHEMLKLLSDLGLGSVSFDFFKIVWAEEMLDSADRNTKH
jgi:hypothetical protein|tara:strand:+ start:829 stop:975 length:147 start_codon:yes stop_codon:yes gene_type:complete